MTRDPINPAFARKWDELRLRHPAFGALALNGAPATALRSLARRT